MENQTDRLLDILRRGHAWKPETRDQLKGFLQALFEERYHQNDWKRFQARPSYMSEDQASFAGWILDRARSGPGGEPAGYAFLFGLCSTGYLIAFVVNHVLAPRYEQIDIDR